MPSPILVISHTHDIHAIEVLGHLARRGADAVLFDTGRLPRETRLTIAHDPLHDWRGAAQFDGRTLDMAAIRAVWWRRPQPFAVHAELGGPADQGFAVAETHAAVSGLWSLLDARWINDPDADDRAARKAWQLKLARQTGLRIPRTCMTNDPDAARAFIAAEPGRVIYKAFSATEQLWRETRVLNADEAVGLDAVRYAPVIFQEFIAGTCDLRVTIVGSQVFAASITASAGAYEYDFRVSMGDVAIAAHDLPAPIERALLALMAALGLVYGAIDLRLTPGGDYVFLEINPAGQWLFVEHVTGQPIGAAIADVLVGWAV
ncbi:ATP-grasp ribosomal peptide maturase [Polymorphobacter glacialis]|uniref:ATP-grasp ribosomal peptide maturase n=1 Tax=Sandarakinorhabdus glacialis TaxID=1614636 RepID=A0A917ECL8_9SPHN|nr:alpha-L-glutamate ligase [Polymorphobacter glacialis]GGE20993.1 ATP-grasp ribosomal peptide maturase [Polymorphobacter glacialis]